MKPNKQEEEILQDIQTMKFKCQGCGYSNNHVYTHGVIVDESAQVAVLKCKLDDAEKRARFWENRHQRLKVEAQLLKWFYDAYTPSVLRWVFNLYRDRKNNLITPKP